MIDFAMSGIVITLSESRGLKGFSILLVIFHHFVQYYADNLPSFLLIFRGVGAIACALFFFLSGYGLSISKHRKNGRYWLRRFLLIYGSFVLASAIFIIFELKSSMSLSVSSVTVLPGVAERPTKAQFSLYILIFLTICM